ncbi:MAG TPA: hypothetical protein VFR08_01225, partial [Candidatus Angelobacter sp.]|nr:hypothetical protein [Candidatus Angelobacter sp.]
MRIAVDLSAEKIQVLNQSIDLPMRGIEILCRMNSKTAMQRFLCPISDSTAILMPAFAAVRLSCHEALQALLAAKARNVPPQKETPYWHFFGKDS